MQGALAQFEAFDLGGDLLGIGVFPQQVVTLFEDFQLLDLLLQIRESFADLFEPLHGVGVVESDRFECLDKKFRCCVNRLLVVIQFRLGGELLAPVIGKLQLKRLNPGSVLLCRDDHIESIFEGLDFALEAFELLQEPGFGVEPAFVLTETEAILLLIGRDGSRDLLEDGGILGEGDESLQQGNLEGAFIRRAGSGVAGGVGFALERFEQLFIDRDIGLDERGVDIGGSCRHQAYQPE